MACGRSVGGSGNGDSCVGHGGTRAGAGWAGRAADCKTVSQSSATKSDALAGLSTRAQKHQKHRALAMHAYAGEDVHT